MVSNPPGVSTSRRSKCSKSPTEAAVCASNSCPGSVRASSRMLWWSGMSAMLICGAEIGLTVPWCPAQTGEAPVRSSWTGKKPIDETAFEDRLRPRRHRDKTKGQVSSLCSCAPTPDRLSDRLLRAASQKMFLAVSCFFASIFRGVTKKRDHKAQGTITFSRIAFFTLPIYLSRIIGRH